MRNKSGKKELRFFIALVVCFLIGAAPGLIGIRLEWAITTIALVMVGACVFVTPITFAIISGMKDEDDEN